MYYECLIFVKGIPIAISLPHFMNADLKSFEDIDGLKPNRSQHESSLVIHPVILFWPCKPKTFNIIQSAV